MKIIVFVTPLVWGGGEIASVRLLQWFHRKGYEVALLMRTEVKANLPECIEPIRLKTPVLKWGKKRYGLFPMSVLANALFLSQSDCSAVIAVGFYSIIPVMLAKRLIRSSVPVIAWEQIHLTQQLRQISKTNGFFGRMMLVASSISYPYSDFIVASSLGVMQDLIVSFRVPKERIRVIYNPTDPEIERKAEEPVEHPWFDGKTQVVLNVARLHPAKDLQTLIRAFSLVRKERQAKLVILGEGEERPKLETMVKELGLENDVWMPGFVDNPFKFMKRASVFVLSSRFEGFGMVIAEALSVGCPVVSTDCPSGPSEILEGGKWGELVPVGDCEALARAILETLDNPPDRERLKRRGMDFHIDKVGQQWLDVINEVVKNS